MKIKGEDRLDKVDRLLEKRALQLEGRGFVVRQGPTEEDIAKLTQRDPDKALELLAQQVKSTQDYASRLQQDSLYSALFREKKLLERDYKDSLTSAESRLVLSEMTDRNTFEDSTRYAASYM